MGDERKSFADVTGKKAANNNSTVPYGVVVLICILAVVLIFVLLGCKLRCRNRNVNEGYARTSLANDSSGSGGYFHPPINFAFATPYTEWSDNPHWKANPQSIRQPLEYSGGADFDAALRRLSDNWDVDPDNTKPPLFSEFDQYYTGERPVLDGYIQAGEPYMTNSLKVRDTLTILGNPYSERQFQQQVQYDHTHDIGSDRVQRLQQRAKNQLQNPRTPQNIRIASRIRADLDQKV